MSIRPEFKTILGIETSCDETAAAIARFNKNRPYLLSNIVSSSLALQAKYGGIVPEQAAREQLKAMIPVIQTALEQAQIEIKDIEAIAVTQGPGLIGSLLVGVETAKVISRIYQKPLIRVNHLLAHFYGNWIEMVIPTQTRIMNINIPKFPALGLLVSGGHTDLILMKGHGKYQYLGGTRDDAAGECFDKAARILGLPYPGGPQISKLAQSGNSQAYQLPRPMLDSENFDFSFSGLKTAVLNLVKQLNSAGQGELTEQQKADLSASIQEAIVEVLVKKVIKAAEDYQINQIMIAGGVAANSRLKKVFNQKLSQKVPNFKLFIPPPHLCTDNGATIATCAVFNPEAADSLTLQVNPSLHL